MLGLDQLKAFLRIEHNDSDHVLQICLSTAVSVALARTNRDTVPENTNESLIFDALLQQIASDLFFNVSEQTLDKLNTNPTTHNLMIHLRNFNI